jgi:hypothetical protein
VRSLRHPGSGQQQHFNFTLQSGDSVAGTFVATATFPQFSAAGTWEIEQLGFCDILGNDGFFQAADLAALSYPSTLENDATADDVAAPALANFTFNPNQIDTTSGDVNVTVTMDLADSPAGVDITGSVCTPYGIFEHPGSGQQQHFNFILDSGNASAGSWVATAVFPQFSALGTWHIQQLEFCDSIGNHGFYQEADLMALSFPATLEIAVGSGPPPPSPDNASGSGPGTVSTGSTTSAADPVETSVTAPSVGPITIDEVPITTAFPAGFRLLGQQVNITAPSASAANPLILVFVIDDSLIPAGGDENSIAIFKNGLAVPNCTVFPGSATATPDPCVSQRTLLAGNDVEITVNTSSASAWNFGVAEAVGGAVDVLSRGNGSDDVVWGLTGSLAALLVAIAASGGWWALRRD